MRSQGWTINHFAEAGPSRKNTTDRACVRQGLRTCEMLPVSSLPSFLDLATSAMRFKSPAALLALASSPAQPFASSAIVPAQTLSIAPAPAPPSARSPPGVDGMVASKTCRAIFSPSSTCHTGRHQPRRDGFPEGVKRCRYVWYF